MIAKTLPVSTEPLVVYLEQLSVIILQTVSGFWQQMEEELPVMKRQLRVLGIVYPPTELERTYQESSDLENILKKKEQEHEVSPIIKLQNKLSP